MAHAIVDCYLNQIILPCTSMFSVLPTLSEKNWQVMMWKIKHIPILVTSHFQMLILGKFSKVQAKFSQEGPKKKMVPEIDTSTFQK